MWVEKGEGPGVRGPEHKPAARSEDSTELGQGCGSIFRRNVFENLDTGQTVEMCVFKRKLLSAGLMKQGAGKSLVGAVEGGRVNLDPGELEIGEKLVAVAQEGPAVASDVQQ